MERAAGVSEVRFETWTVPDVGALRPAIRRSALDFPQPDGPSKDTNSPLRTSRSSGPTAVTPLSYTLVTPRRLTARPAARALASDTAMESAIAPLVQVWFLSSFWAANPARRPYW